MASRTRTHTLDRIHVPALTALSVACAVLLTACGGGGGSASTPPTTTASENVNVPLMISDASSEDWSAITVTVTSVVFVSSAGNTANLLSAPVTVNLEQLDGLGEALGSASLVSGTIYTGAILTISANPGDVGLTVSGDPEAGFPEAASTSTTPDVIPASRIQIQGATGSAGSMTVSVPVKFATPFTAPAATSATNPTPATTTGIDVEFDLSHPAFIVGHAPVGGGSTIWAVNFKGPVKHKPVDDLRHLVLRHMYGTVSSVSSDNTTLTITRDWPTIPLVSPETFTAGTTPLPITVDATNGTLFYDVDAKTHSTIHDLSTVAASLTAGKYVRVAARYQQDGTLVATRIWTSATFNSVFVSPEGHVLHVDGVNGTSFTVDNADGRPITLAVDANTQFFFRNPGTAADVTPIGTGPTFLTLDNLARGFKVHVTPVDLTASPIVAATVDIESAPYDGTISEVTTTGFALTHDFATARDDYAVSLSYISAATANGKDPLTGNAITGFKYWDFAYPTEVTSGTGAVADFMAATGGSVNFGGTAGAYKPAAVSYATWGDAADVNGWSAPQAILLPTVIPHTTVAAAIASGASSFTINAAGGTTPVTVDFSTATGSATLVYQVDRTNGVVTVSPQDITTSAGLAALTAGIQAGAKVQVSAVPQSDGSLKAYVISYYTGTLPTN
jgi:hypothetical protein